MLDNGEHEHELCGTGLSREMVEEQVDAKLNPAGQVPGNAACRRRVEMAGNKPLAVRPPARKNLTKLFYDRHDGRFILEKSNLYTSGVVAGGVP